MFSVELSWQSYGASKHLKSVLCQFCPKDRLFCNETKLFLPDRSVSVASSLSSQPLRPSSACKQLSTWLDPAEANAETDWNTEKAKKERCLLGQNTTR